MGLLVYACFYYFYLIPLIFALKSGFSSMRRAFDMQKDLSDEEKADVRKRHSLILAQWTFCVYLFIMCIASFGLLHWITNKFSYFAIIQSGLIVPIWLFLSGIIIRKFYYFLGQKLWFLVWIDESFDEKQMEVYWIMIPIISSLVYSLYNFNLALMVIAIVIGKFLWLDTICDMKEIKSKIKSLIVENKDSLEVIYIFAIHAVEGGLSFFVYRFLYKMGFTSPMFFLIYIILSSLSLSLIVDLVMLKCYKIKL